MAARRAYHVTYHAPEGEWVLEEEGASRAVGCFARKEDAVRRAAELGENQRPALVRIHKQDGTIQEERTYGDDPYPPEG